MMKNTRSAKATLILLSLLAIPARAGSRAGDGHGFAKLHDRLGHEVGDVELHQKDGELDLHVTLYSLAQGEYVLGAYSRGECVSPYTSAGKPLPLGSREQTGFPVYVEADGGAELDFRTRNLSLHDAHALFDWDGSSFLLAPAAAQDLPLACGVIKV